jgi:phosphoribosylformylglycinamidine cyclo-ligase
VCCGARPLFFLDYQLLGRVNPAQVRALMTGIAAGCRTAGCAIVGGELAEHPGLLAPGEADLAGFAVGIVERDRIIDGPARTKSGDVLIGLPSPGLRSNGYSLARQALLEQEKRPLDGPAWEGAGEWTLADELLRPSTIYTPAILALVDAVDVHAVAHITGGGLPGNVVRVLGTGVDAVFDRSRWATPRIFSEVQRAGDVDDDEMARVFNLGLGMVVAVDRADVDATLKILNAAGQDARAVGQIESGRRQVRLM